MVQGYPCLKKDKRLLVLFAFGVLVLFSDLKYFPPQIKSGSSPQSWYEIHGQKEQILFRITPSGQHLLLKSEILANVNEIEPGMAYGFEQMQDSRATQRPLSARLSFFLGRPFFINTAEISDLMLIDGLGPVLAENIVAYRKTQGPIMNARQLEEIPGIGPRTAQKLTSHFTFTPDRE